MPAWLQWIWTALIEALPSLAIVVPVLYFMVRLVIEKMISREFENEREALRFQIATLLSRSTKIHDKEFAALEELWEKASHAVGSASSVLSLVQTAPDLTYMEGPELDHMLAKLELPGWQTDELKSLRGVERTSRCSEFWRAKKRRIADEHAAAFHDFVIIKGIFLKAEIETKATELSKLIWELLDEDRWSSQEEGQNGMKSRRELSKRIRDEGDALRNDVRLMVRARLWDIDLKKG